MKNYIIGGVVFILLLLAGLIGAKLGQWTYHSIADPSMEAIKKAEHQRDSVIRLFNESVQREQVHILRIEADSAKALELQHRVAQRESKLKTYEQRLNEYRKIVVSQPDSFLIKRFPE